MTHIRYMLLISRQGKLRMMRWYYPFTSKEKTKIINELTQIILVRKPKMCNIIEYMDHRVVYRRYASLFFVCGITTDVDNELLTLDIIHRYVETMDKYFGNVCELDIIFNFTKAYDLLNEMILCDGALAESDKSDVLHQVLIMDTMEKSDHLDRVLS